MSVLCGLPLKTSDGQHFDDETLAQLHQDALTALENFDKARSALMSSISANHYLTADGEQFTIQNEMWVIVETPYEPPWVKSVELYWHSSEARLRFSNGAIVVSWRADSDRRVEKPVSQFYASERAAYLALIERRKTHLQWWADDLQKLEEKWAVKDGMRTDQD